MEIVHPYRNMTARSGRARPMYPFRGTYWSPRGQEATRWGIAEAREVLRELFGSCRRLEASRDALRARLETTKTLRDLRIAEQPAPAEWARRKAEFKTRRDRGELDAKAVQKAMVDLKHERQQVKDDIDRPMNEFMREVDRLGHACDAAGILAILEGRASLVQ